MSLADDTGLRRKYGAQHTRTPLALEFQAYFIACAGPNPK
jgi:hypothetical protein